MFCWFELFEIENPNLVNCHLGKPSIKYDNSCHNIEWLLSYDASDCNYLGHVSLNVTWPATTLPKTSVYLKSSTLICLFTVRFIELRREQNGRLYPNVLLLIHLYRRFSEFHQKDLRLLTSDPTESGVHIEPTSIYFGFSISCEFLTHFLSNPLPLFATHEARAAACVCVVCASPCRLRYCTIVLLSYISPLCTNSVPGDVVYIMWGVSAWWRDSNATAEM